MITGQPPLIISRASSSSFTPDAQQLLMTTISNLNLKQNDDGVWYVDSGAAAHVTDDAGKLSSASPYLAKGSVVTGDGTHHKITHIGNAYVSLPHTSLPLHNVLVVPNVKKNIISVSKLIDDSSTSVEFTPSSVFVKDPLTKTIFAEGIREGNMYVLKEAPPVSKSSSSVSFPISPNEVNLTQIDMPSIWHNRLGHCSHSFISSLVNNGLLHKSSMRPVSESGMCSSCQLCKSHALPFNSINKRASKLFETIYSDVWGPAPVSSPSGSRYYVIFVDFFFSLYMDTLHKTQI